MCCISLANIIMVECFFFEPKFNDLGWDENMDDVGKFKTEVASFVAGEAYMTSLSSL